MASSTVKTTESCDNKTTSCTEEDVVDLEIKFEGTVLPSNDDIKESEGTKKDSVNAEDEKKAKVESKKEKNAAPVKGKTPRRKGPKKSSSSSAKSNLEERAKDPSPVALLDMLAEVASATLKNDPSILHSSPRKTNKNIPGKQSSKIPPKRSAQSEVLNLDQIRMLSDKLLLNMFAELTADEIRRNYTYICFLMPEKCQQKYTSFGNENRARLQMKTHLLGHIAELLSDANTAGRSQRGKFVAEPVPARKRRLATEHDTIKKRKCARKILNKSEKTKAVGKVMALKSKSRTNSNRSSGTDAGSGNSGNSSSDPVEYTKIRESKDGSSGGAKSMDESDPHLAVDSTKNYPGGDKCEAPDGKSSLVNRVAASDSAGETEKGIGNEGGLQVSAAISFEQPFHDHCYTTADGGKKSLEFFEDYDEEGDEEDDEDEDCDESEERNDNDKQMKMTSGPEDGSTRKEENKSGENERATANIPKFFMELVPTVIAPVKTVVPSQPKEAEAALRQLESVRLIQTKRPRKQILTETKMAEDEDAARALAQDNDGFDSLDDDDDVESGSKAEKGSPEWERKLALKCIRLLRTKKKDERVALVCKICKDKMFTAQATLMYHYRSHAGIKPFVCNICNTTFTRQHSLNYHMLIHNNKSRFTCNDCGRKFRHPSHFKEHMRRHTGETPFECSDCGVRFKTRNTYKRHLKTRHGKLLTVNGIVTLSAEEFLKVKTNPKRRPRPRKDKETQWPEVSASSISTINIDLGTVLSAGPSRNQATLVMEQDIDASCSNMDIDGEECRVESQQKVVVRSANEYSIAVTGEADCNGEPQTAAISIGTDPIQFGCTAEFAAAHLQSGENVALTFVECSRDGVSTLVALPIIKQEPNDDDEEGEWILPEMEVFPPSATATLHPILRCM